MRIKSYNDCETLWATRKRKLANNTYLTQPEPGRFAIRLHSTDVVTYLPDRAILRTGGWLTHTTKDRINEFGPARVRQEKGEWWVRCGEADILFQDGMEVEPDGSIVKRNPIDTAQRAKLRKRILAYAIGYAKALLAGDVPAPSGGDCWPCALREVKSGKAWGDQDTDHLLSHIDERYYVPSLLRNAVAEQPGLLSNWDSNILAGLWSGHVAEARQQANSLGMFPRRIRKIVANYMLRRFQMVPTR